MIRDSTEIPDYKNIFDPQQLEMEAHLAKLLTNNTSQDKDIQKMLAKVILKVVLGVYRPDMFEGYKPPELCPWCNGTEDCKMCDGSGVIPCT